MSSRVVGVAAIVATLLAVIVVPGGAQEAQYTRDLRLPMSDGVELLVRVGGRGPLVDGEMPPRPVIAEFSPYGPGCCPEVAGSGYNYVQVHVRGTGASAGSFDALGPTSQSDVVEVLDWICQQPWSNGRTGLAGFSASAILIYNSLHQHLPCVETAVLGSGTHELYRDLLYPGGIPNGVPALGVFALIGGPLIASGPERMAADPASSFDAARGMATTAVDYLAHPTLDDYWKQRGFRGDVNNLPILMVNGFFDVESRGAFQAFQALRDGGAHLLVVGAHDGVPAGSGGSGAAQRQWYDRHLRDLDNGLADLSPVRLFMADGDRVEMLRGSFVTFDGQDWPTPGTEWHSLHLTPERSGTSPTINDGTLSLQPGPVATVAYPAVPSLGTATDPYSTSILGVFDVVPPLTHMTTAEPLGLAFTTAPLAQDVWAAGPASLEVVLASTAPETDIFAVISDVHPDGSAHPMAAGRLRSSYPDVDLERSLVTSDGRVVQPYGRYDMKDDAAIGTERRYHVEFWPVGNRFREGHRIRLHILGASSYHQPGVPTINTIRLGPDGSRLQFPVLPNSNLPQALGQAEADPWENGAGGARLSGDCPNPDRGSDRSQRHERGCGHDHAIHAASSDAPLPATGRSSLATLLAMAAMALAAATRLRAQADRGGRPGAEVTQG